MNYTGSSAPPRFRTDVSTRPGDLTPSDGAPNYTQKGYKMIPSTTVLQQMRGANAPVHLGGSLVGQKGHICAFFSSADEEYRTLLPFIRDGLECGEAAFHTVDPARASDHVNRHRAAGIDVDSYRGN